MRIARRAEAPDLISLRRWLKGTPDGRKRRRMEYAGYFLVAAEGVFSATIIPAFKLFDFNLWWLVPVSVAAGSGKARPQRQPRPRPERWWG